MADATVYKANVWEDGGLFVMARVYGNAGTAITQASLTSIAYAVTLKSDGSTITSGSVTVSSSVFDTLQTSDPRWTRDSTGYNFSFAVPVAAFPTADERYRVKFTFTPTSGSVFFLVFEAYTVRKEY